MSLGMGVEALRRPRLVPGLPGVPPVPSAPSVLRAPAVTAAAGEAGRIGTALAGDPGAFAGRPAPTLVLHWQRDGVDIPGAQGAAFTPPAALDGVRVRLQVTAANDAGRVTAYSDDILIHQAAPVLRGPLPNLVFSQNSGVQILDVSPDFMGGSLTFGVTGEGVEIDPATGLVSIATDVLRDGLEAIVTARNSGGTATGSFRVTVQAIAPGPQPTVPQLLVPPVLVGSGVIGTEHRVDPGVWQEAASLTLQWRRDGVDIPGAVEALYVPRDADDLGALTCRVTATNEAGDAEAESAALAMVQAAPVLAGSLADVVLVQGGEDARIAAAAAFDGAALHYAVSGGGAVVEAATGVVRLSAVALVANETVTVRATNSGGSVETDFRFTVEAAAVGEPEVAAPAALGTIADLRFAKGSGLQSLSAQAFFSGDALVYALEAAPEGVTIRAGSGLVEIATDALLDAVAVTVRADNAAGSAAQSFAVTVQATSSIFDADERLADLAFVAQGAAPDWKMNRTDFARLVPGTEGRVHGEWHLAGGDGLYRCLARWNSKNVRFNGFSPFVFGARIAKSGADFSGLYVEASRTSGVLRQLRIQQYTGVGDTVTELAAVASDWVWYNWYWFEMEIVGGEVKARLYPETAVAPDWQVSAATAQTQAGAFGPSAFPIGGVAPTLDIKQLEFVPRPSGNGPAAALDANWELGQITERT